MDVSRAALSCGYPCVFVNYWTLAEPLTSSRPIPFKMTRSMFLHASPKRRRYLQEKVSFTGTHKAAMSHSAEVLRLQFELDTHATISQHEAEEASWSVLWAKLTCQAEHTCQLEVAHSCAMAELSIQ